MKDEEGEDAAKAREHEDPRACGDPVAVGSEALANGDVRLGRRILAGRVDEVRARPGNAQRDHCLPWIGHSLESTHLAVQLVRVDGRIDQRGEENRDAEGPTFAEICAPFGAWKRCTELASNGCPLSKDSSHPNAVYV